MSCVNKNSKEFKDTVSRLDVHPDNLEVILHKYLNEEDRFPTDPEIMRELRAKPFEATDAEVKFYLKANHQGRKIFGSLSEATRQLNTFKTLYSGNPTIYRNSLGNYVVEAGIPMLKGVPITEGIPFTMDNTTIDQVLQSLDDTNPYHNTFRALVDVLGKENIRIGMEKLRLEDTTMKDKEGKYEDPLAVYGTEGIKFDPFNMRKHLDKYYDINDVAGRASEFRRVLLHEMTHQLTRRILTSEDNTLRPEELKFKKEIERLYQEALDAIDRKKFPYYGLESIEEFVSEAFSNRDFQRHLNRIKSGKRTLWNKFVGALKSMLDSLSSTSVDNSILYNIIGATSELMVYTKAERERVESERAIMNEIAEETYSELPPDDFFDSPASRSSGGLYNKLFSLNGVRDGGYSLEKRTWSKGDYMVLNIPTYRTTLKEAIDKGYEILEKQGLSRIDYIVDDKLKEFRGSQYLNVRPRNKVEREQARIKAEKEALEKKDEREAYEEYQLELLTEEENALKGLTQGEIDFINRIEETSPILAQQVLDGLVPFDVAYDIVRNGEQTPYSSSKDTDYSLLAKTVSTEGVTEQYGVIIDKALKQNYPTWQSNNPEGIVAYRVNFNKYNTPEEAAAGRIGNPFSENARGQSTVEQFFIWLTTGENFGNEKATEEYRQAILEKILNTPNNAPILYYTELNRPSHATVLGYLINHKELLIGVPEVDELNNSEIKFYEGNITPDDNTIFVFGSNPTGIHGAGAAKVAREQFGAKAGVGEGLTGNSYALPTKDLNKAKGTRWYRPSQKEEQEVKEWYKNHDYSEVINHPLNQERSIAPQQIIDSIKNLYLEASQHPDKQFKISNYPLDKISLNGYLGYEMLEMFKAAGQIPSNIVFSKTWIDTGRLTKDNFINEETYTEEQETTNQEQQQIKKENQTYMENSVSITQQIDNLNSASILSATEVRHIAEQAVYWISDHITELQEKPGLAEKIYGESLKDKDLSSMSRADVVRTIGPDAVKTMCREKFSPENTDYEDFATVEKAEIITDNWDAIMMLASDVFLNVEDFSIVYSKDGNTSEVNEDLVADADNFNSSNMEGDVLENEGDLQEHWQVETKTLDVLTTMSQMVKQALTKCYLLDRDGNKITSEFGINERINVREATNSILRWTQGALNLEQVISKLKEKADSNPWVRQIIDKLSDTSGKEADFQGQFFGTFCKHFQSYAVVIEENGKYKSIQVNENPALSEAMTQVTTQYKIGEHPLFTTEGINKEAFNELKSAFKDLEKFNHTGYDLTKEETKEEAARILGYVSNLLGYYVTPDMVAENLNKETFKKMYSALNYITRSLEENLDNAAYEPFKFKSKDGINGNTREFLKPITDHLEDTTVSAFYDSGKMYQSYITPSYTSKLFQKFSQTGKTFDDFLMEEYGKVPWFHTGTKIERGWRNAWLQKLATDSNARKVFKHKVQLNFNKHNYMKNMSDMEYTLSVVTEYFSENASEKQTKVPAWFRVPMLSNKPSSEFIRFYSERGTNYKESLTNGFKMIFDQELSRIQTVEMRNLSKEDPRFIKNFDTNGKKFMFLDFMNAYLTGDKKSSELGKLIRQKLDGHKVDEVRLNELAKEAIMQTMEDRAESIVANWEAQGILKGAEKIANIGTTEEEIRENLINFVWNDTFAAMNIMQLTITDIAFYKDAEDLQKRLAQIHAPGVRGNAKATDYEGNPVTDGNFRTIKLTDFDSFISNIIDNVSVVFDRKIDSAPDSEKGALRALKESLVGEDGAFRQINVADAQGYSSPTSYRKKAFVFGKWSRESEEVYQKLRSGTYTYKDLKIAFQPLKPFVYSQITKDAGIEGAPLNSLKVPVQFKNSEYLLIMADAILQNENTGRPNLLRAIFNVMEESHYDKDGNYKTDGIDTVQFESTVKSGLMGKINLNDLVEDPNGETIAKVRMESAIYDSEGVYNNTSVDTVPFEDYCLQQEVPEHFKDHAQVHGSQLRYIIVSELDNFNYLGEPVTYNLEGKQVTAEEFKAEYENTIAENIQDSINELSEELGLNSFSIKDRNIALSKILQREILSSPRYGIDLLQACSVDENGRFRIPLGDPIQSKRVEQLINSVIKNRINKQKIAGGPVVQVTNYGTSKELNIRFKDKEGNLLMTRAEYEKNPIRKEVSQSDKFNARYKKGNKTSSNVVSYEDYIKENQAGIAYFEVFAPIYSNQLFTQFADKNGVINMQALEMLDPDLLKMIGYRIPTEDKYSMAPLKIVGFLPREAGDGIMLPNDITLLTGSDFDVDKEYLMRKEYSIKKSNTKRGDIHRILYDELVSSQKGPLSYDTKVELHDLVDQFLEDPFDSSSLVNQKTAKGYMTMPKGAYNKMLKIYMQNMYTVEKPTEGRTYRNNKIVDMTYEVLTHETSAEKMLNPGGFDPQRKMGYLVSAYKKYSDKYTWEQLQDMSISELKDLDSSNKNISYIDTHIQFYKQNSAAGSLIGIFAVNRTAHAVLESGTPDGSAEYLMNVDNVCKISKVFTVAGMEFGGNMPFDMRYDRNGQLIGKTLGSLVAASADAVKDPVLNLMNINSNTASILTTLVRFGMPFNDAALFLSQSVISEVLADFSRENITGYTSLSKVIQKKLDQLRKDANIDESSELNNEELTYKELVKGLKPDVKPEIAYKTLLAFSNFQKMAGAIRMPTFATRFNSMSSAVGPLIIDNLITEHEMEKLSLESNILDKDLNPVDMNNIFSKHPILGQFQNTVGIARQLFGNMPANSTGFRNILYLISESSLSNTIFKDRKLLSSLSDFYQSYLVMKGGVIDPGELGSTITEFPKEFMKEEYKKKYTDNALIQAIKYGTDKSDRLTLQVDISGLDTQQKEKLSSAWIDLHKMDPELSIKLFNYNFFRGGIGFSPKTFMSLVPVYVKERIPNYIDTFRVLPTVVPEIVLDQFIRNNWDNNKLVPRKKVTFEQLPNGNMKVSKPSEVEDLTGVTYFKTKINNEDKLFMQVLEGDGTIEVMEITPLGSNKEYIEMSETSIDSPLNIPTEAKVEVPESEVGKQSELGESETSAETEDSLGNIKDTYRLEDLLYKVLVIEGVRNEEQAKDYIKDFKSKTAEEKAALEKGTKKFLKARFEKLNIKFDEKLIDDVYKLIC